MAANLVDDAPNTGNAGEGASNENSLSCLEPLLKDNNKKLSQQQKNIIKQIVEHFGQSDEAPFELSAHNVPRSESDAFAMDDNISNINWYSLILNAFIVCISSFIYGFGSVEASLIIDPSEPIQAGSLNHEFDNLSSFEQQSLIPSSSLIGACIGSISLFLFYPSITYKRKTILLFSNIPIIIGCVLSISAISPIMLIIGLIFKGFGFGISSVIAPIILAEIAPTPTRQYITFFHQLFITFGILIVAAVTMSLINFKNGWRYIVGILIIPSILQLCLYKYIPSTPRWLIANAKYQDAKQIIAKFYGIENINDLQQYDDVKKEYEYIYNHIAIDVVKETNNWKKSLFIAVVFNIMLQWTGINVVIYRSQQALKNQQIDKDNVFIAIIILYSINFISTVISIICVKMRYFRKKTLYLIGTCLMLLASLFLGLINTVYGGNQQLIDQLSVSQIPLYVFGFAISLGLVVWDLITEAFPFENRIKFGCICIFTNWFANATLSLSVDDLVNALNGNIGNLYYIFCGMIILCIIYIKKYIPETAGKSLEYAVKMYVR